MHAHGLTLRFFATPDSAARALAREVARAVSGRPRFTLGLPTGRTPVPLYRELARLHTQQRADFSGVTTFNLDEFLGVAPSDPGSYRAFMQRHLFSHVNIAPRRIHFLSGMTDDPGAECLRYERQIARAGGLDLLLLGLGTNGHIGFNEPGTSLVADSHRTRLTEGTRRSNAALFGNRTANVPTEALSMGMGTILRARRIILLATGPSKAVAVKRLVQGRITPQVPASFLQLHRAAEVWVDRAAAARLSVGGT